jgi:hypothetical protein
VDKPTKQIDAKAELFGKQDDGLVNVAASAGAASLLVNYQYETVRVVGPRIISIKLSLEEAAALSAALLTIFAVIGRKKDD